MNVHGVNIKGDTGNHFAPAKRYTEFVLQANQNYYPKFRIPNFMFLNKGPIKN